jgi:5'(3')-deoxyribonucleotidase
VLSFELKKPNNIALKCHFRGNLKKHKDFLKKDYLIDDRLKHGAKDFEGELILFGSDRYKNWTDVKNYLLVNSQ